MTTLAQPPVDLHSPPSFHVHSSEIIEQEDMEQSDEADANLRNTHETQHSQAQPHPPTSPPLFAPSDIQHARDFDMEGGEDTAGISPSPWDTVGFDAPSQHASAGPQELVVEVTSAATPTAQPLSASPTLPPITQDPSLLAITPADPSPDLGIVSVADEDFRPDFEDGHGHAPSSDQGDGDDSGEEDEEDEESSGHIMQFYPFEEDASVPSAEELKIISTSAEHSALDHQHWQTRAFFDTKDPEVLPKDSGIIDWTVEAFNGTKENPRKELLLRSPVVRIGNHDWRIKLLPRGHLSTDRVSVYVECVSLQDQAQEEWPEGQLPLPTIDKAKLPKRQAVAAQVSVLMYNPEEPRVHEFRSDAHQFQPDSTDHGWSRFTTVPWYEIHRRSYMARQPLLRDDKLALKAFIRIVYDPTGCLWAHNDINKPQDSVPMTGLQHLPAFDDLAIGPVLALLLHLRPFRQLVYLLGPHDLVSQTSQGCNPLTMLQAVLYRMRTRCQEPVERTGTTQINHYIDHLYDEDRDSHDIVQTTNSMLCDIEGQLKLLSLGEGPVAAAARSALDHLTGVLGSRELQVSGSRKTRLSIVNKSSMQEVIEGGKDALESLASPEVLMIELDRQVFDHEKRCWKKLLDKVRLDDEINVGGTMYTLYGFAAHSGYLQAGRYSSFFRPHGLGNLWYTYRAGRPECLTVAKAVTPREGSTRPKASTQPAPQYERLTSFGGLSHLHGEGDSVAYVVLYVRSDDVASDTFYKDCPEDWDVPKWIVDDYKSAPPPPPPVKTDSTAASIAGLHEQPTANIDTAHDFTIDEGGWATVEAPVGAENADTEMNDAVSVHEDVQEIPIVDNNREPAKQDIDMTIRHEILNYFSQPFYDGHIQKGDYHGDGHLIDLNGDEYIGTFARGSREGQGKMTYQNGDTYEGSWCEGQHDGQGTYMEKRTGNVYTGNYSEGKKHGEGTTIWKTSEEQSRLCQICYVVDANAAFYDCGHVVACAGCARRVDDCPVCRRKVRDVLKLYYTA